ncbi:MAG: hypothetical protein F6J93_19375 [Oscillatoria sp. SIO1A7]|nr:hypothetical protein [Oscillatoria sp. SIO1A7]
MTLTPKSFTKILASSILALGATATFTQPSEAQNQRFFCGTDNHPSYGNVPATIARTTRGNVPMIDWVSNWIKDPRWTPQARCEAVAQRFQRYYDNGTLKYMRTGTFRDYPVICVARDKGGSCVERDILVTLEQGSDASETLAQMTDVRRRVGGPLLLSDDLIFYVDGETYVDIEVFLNEAEVREGLQEGLQEKPQQEPQQKPQEELEELW